MTVSNLKVTQLKAVSQCINGNVLFDSEQWCMGHSEYWQHSDKYMAKKQLLIT